MIQKRLKLRWFHVAASKVLQYSAFVRDVCSPALKHQNLILIFAFCVQRCYLVPFFFCRNLLYIPIIHTLFSYHSLSRISSLQS